MRLGSHEDPIANFGRQAADSILSRVGALPVRARVEGLKQALNAISPIVRSAVESKAAMLRSRYNAPTALRKALEIVLANRFATKIISDGKQALSGLGCCPLGGRGDTLGPVRSRYNSLGAYNDGTGAAVHGHSTDPAQRAEDLAAATTSRKMSLAGGISMTVEQFKQAEPANYKKWAAGTGTRNGAFPFAVRTLDGERYHMFYSASRKWRWDQRPRGGGGIGGSIVSGIKAVGKAIGEGVEKTACLATKVPGFEEAAMAAGGAAGGPAGAKAGQLGAQIAKDKACSGGKSPPPLVTGESGGLSLSSPIVIGVAALVAYLVLR